MRAIVYKVLDGDTIKAFYAGLEIVLRVANVDAPELYDPFGKESKQILTDLLPQESEIDFVSLRRDNYGRYVADITTENDAKVDEILVVQGAVFHWEKYSSKIEILTNLEQKAKFLGVGIWEKSNMRARYHRLLYELAVSPEQLA